MKVYRAIKILINRLSIIRFYKYFAYAEEMKCQYRKLFPSKNVYEIETYVERNFNELSIKLLNSKLLSLMNPSDTHIRIFLKRIKHWHTGEYYFRRGVVPICIESEYI